jgi:hypothetical protein
MDQSPAAEFPFSPGYARLTANIALASAPPWGLLIATWRDSMIIALLYVADSLLFRATQLVNATSRGLESYFYYFLAVEPIVGVLLLMTVFVVAFLRVRALSDWIAEQK